MSSATNSREGKEAYWYWVLVACNAFVTLCGNSLVIYLIASRPRLHTTPNWFVLSLAIADFSIGLVIAPTYIMSTFWVRTDSTTLAIFYNLLLYASVGNHCVMTFDRYIAITRPLRYPSFMKDSTVLKLIACAWGVPFMISLIPLSWEHNTSVSKPKQKHAEQIFKAIVLVLFEIIPCIIMLFTCLHLLVIVRNQSRRICRAEAQVMNRYNLSTTSRGRKTQEKAVVRMVVIVVLVFEICWLLSAYRATCKYFNFCQVSLRLVQSSRLFLFFNSAINVFVYAFLKRDIRGEMKRFFTWVRPTS